MLLDLDMGRKMKCIDNFDLVDVDFVVAILARVGKRVQVWMGDDAAFQLY